MLHGCDERQPRTGIRRGARGFCPEVAPFGAAQRGSAESLRRFDIMPSVMTLRRLVLFVLLLTVPFQAAIGAAGSICSHGSSDAVTDAATEDERFAAIEGGIERGQICDLERDDHEAGRRREDHDGVIGEPG